MLHALDLERLTMQQLASVPALVLISDEPHLRSWSRDLVGLVSLRERLKTFLGALTFWEEGAQYVVVTEALPAITQRSHHLPLVTYAPCRRTLTIAMRFAFEELDMCGAAQAGWIVHLEEDEQAITQAWLTAHFAPAVHA